jgi:hypothetical protein
MTLLDNLTAQLSPDRKEKFIELFRQLQVKKLCVKKSKEKKLTCFFYLGKSE